MPTLHVPPHALFCVVCKPEDIDDITSRLALRGLINAHAQTYNILMLHGGWCQITFWVTIESLTIDAPPIGSSAPLVSGDADSTTQ